MFSKPAKLNTVPVAKSAGGQRGSALIVSLVMLLLMTLVGVASMQGTILQERMSGNLRDRELAFEATETALRVGEGWAVANVPTALAESLLVSPDAWDGSDPSGTVADLDDQLSADPAFHVAWQGDVCPPGADFRTPCRDIFAVTARGQGGSDTTTVVLQSRVMP